MEATQTTGISQTPKAIVTRTDKDFVDGVCSGYLTYFDEYQGIPLSDRDVYTFLVNNLLDAQVPTCSMLGTVLAGLKLYWKIDKYYSSIQMFWVVFSQGDNT